MRTLILFLAALLLSTQLQAAESKLTKSFIIKEKPEVVKTWMQGHRNSLLEATGCEIVDASIPRNGIRVVKVKRETPKGVFIFELRERIDGNEFTSKFIQSYSGELIGQTTKITVKPHKNKTEVIIEIWAEVDRNDVTGLEIRVDLVKSINGIKKAISKMFDEE